MTGPEAEALVLRWAYCRCRYARRPDDPCSCTPGVLVRAVVETKDQTRRWEKTLAAREGLK